MNKCLPFCSSHLLAAASSSCSSSQLIVVASLLVCTGEVISCLLPFSYSPMLIKPHPFFFIPIPYIVAVPPPIGLLAISTLTLVSIGVFLPLIPCCLISFRWERRGSFAISRVISCLLLCSNVPSSLHLQSFSFPHL